MRDAFGGAFMLKLFLVFIFVYICFTAVALNYAKAFKVKNVIIDYLESNEIPSIDSINARDLEKFSDFIDEEILGNYNYNMSEYNMCNGQHIQYITENGKTVGLCHEAGIIIMESGRAENTEGVYYTVSTFLGWNIGFLNKLTELNGNNQKPGVVTGTWRISGETRLIVCKN